MQTRYELKAATGKTAAIALISFVVFLVFIYWLVLRVMNMRFGDLFSVPWDQALAIVASLIAAGGAIAVSKAFGQPNRVRVVLDDDSISTVLLGHGDQELRLLQKVAFADVERLWFPASGNMLILSRRRKSLLTVGFSLFERASRSTFESLVRDLKTRMGVQEATRRSVWWRPALGGTEYPNPGFILREIPPAAPTPVSDGKFIVLWILAGTVGLLVGQLAGAIATLIVFGISTAFSGDAIMGSDRATDVGVVLSIVVGAAISGAIVGAAQLRVLRRRIMNKVRWTMATSLGLVGAVLVVGGIILGAERISGSVEFLSTVNEPLLAAVGGLLTGSVWSAGQWVVLGPHTSRAVWWIPANAGATAAAAATMAILMPFTFGREGSQFGLISMVQAIPAVVAGGLLWSALTGLALVWLFRSHTTIGG